MNLIIESLKNIKGSDVNKSHDDRWLQWKNYMQSKNSESNL